ncbi:hypothetical protein TNCV_869241 [Trichonephila clavipes]|nr:hypothetical protein TNCV_869241 [Trichonephila clavipes]
MGLKSQEDRRRGQYPFNILTLSKELFGSYRAMTWCGASSSTMNCRPITPLKDAHMEEESRYNSARVPLTEPASGMYEGHTTTKHDASPNAGTNSIPVPFNDVRG